MEMISKYPIYFIVYYPVNLIWNTLSQFARYCSITARPGYAESMRYVSAIPSAGKSLISAAENVKNKSMFVTPTQLCHVDGQL